MQKLTCVEIEYNDIEDGKRVTIRKGYRQIQLGDLEFKCKKTNRTLIVDVLHVIHSLVENIPTEYVRNDGFIDKHDLVNQLKEYYPNINEKSEVTIISFR